jgi:hypothetical protein
MEIILLFCANITVRVKGEMCFLAISFALFQSAQEERKQLYPAVNRVGFNQPGVHIAGDSFFGLRQPSGKLRDGKMSGEYERTDNSRKKKEQGDEIIH